MFSHIATCCCYHAGYHLVMDCGSLITMKHESTKVKPKTDAPWVIRFPAAQKNI